MIKNKLIGVGMALAVSVVSMLLSKYSAFQAWGLSSVTVAILLGMLIGNTIYGKIAAPCAEGVNFAKGQLLRLGIILYGFNLTFQQIASVGGQAILADALMLSSTFILTWLLGRYIFAMDEHTTILMGSGASICGAAAVLATESAIKADSDKVTVAVATVVIFGTIAMFWYPEMYQLGWWPISDESYGIYIGSSVHEVAQVYASGGNIGQTVVDIAVTTKMIRVIMLAPFLLVLMWWLSLRQSHQGEVTRRLVIPWFAVWFIAVAGFNSLHLLPESWVLVLKLFDQILLTTAMAALGITTHLSAIKQAGIKPMLLAAIIFLWLVVAGGLLQVAMVWQIQY